MREVMPTRAAAMELADERKLMRQGYELLDETRMLLAREMLRQLQSYEAGVDAMLAQLHAASAALADGIERHGLDMLQVYPAASPPQAPGSTRTGFLGVALRSAQAVELVAIRCGARARSVAGSRSLPRRLLAAFAVCRHCRYPRRQSASAGP